MPLITEKRLQANRELLIGQKIKRFYPGHGGALGTVKKYSVSNDMSNSGGSVQSSKEVKLTKPLLLKPLRTIDLERDQK